MARGAEVGIAGRILRRVFPAYSVARMIEGLVPKGESVFAVNGTADVYTTREIRVSFQSASNLDLNDTFHMGEYPVMQPLIAQVFAVPGGDVRGVRVLETNPSEALWAVHEVRFYHVGKEIPRDPAWRLGAYPNAWQVGFAFDNSLETRWRTWEATPANSYVEAVFGRPEKVDEIRVFCAPDFEWTHLQIQVSRNGVWQALDVNPKVVELGEPRQVRREAIHELALRGIHYILLQPSDPGYTDVAEDPEGWGLRKIGDARGAVLYRSVW